VAAPGRFLFAVSVCAVCLAGIALARTDVHTNLRLIFDASHVLTPLTRAMALAEAARIWRRYDVLLDDDGDGQCAASTPAALRVTIDVGHDSQSPDAGLGAIQFAADGRPESVIVLNFDAVARIATSAPVMGLHPALWPAGLRSEIVARALGRALAHEVGHYLLRSPHHGKGGLMRARHNGSALGDPSDRAFVLSESERARLRLALAAPLETMCPTR